LSRRFPDQFRDVGDEFGCSGGPLGTHFSTAHADHVVEPPMAGASLT
jgi:hypothetical protein